MSGDDYKKEMGRLSRNNGEKYHAITSFLEPLGILNTAQLLELGRLRDEYVEAFTEWMEFCEAHSGSEREEGA